MYIPAEAVYYHIVKDEELAAYSKSRKVVFVSPNTFYAYLQAILYGLRGVNIQRNIQRIFAELSSLGIDMEKFQDDFDVLGNHLANASTKYRDAGARLTKVSEKIAHTVQRPLLEDKEESQ